MYVIIKNKYFWVNACFSKIVFSLVRGILGTFQGCYILIRSLSCCADSDWSRCGATFRDALRECHPYPNFKLL